VTGSRHSCKFNLHIISPCSHACSVVGVGYVECLFHTDMLITYADVQCFMCCDH